ncbi:hypothetical protein BpHYR1_005704 [Brachionus plicatilis]|uniref:Uncharacterized protein n=1 Tax=Brachionus plicatilis TaxID=10195 RepID=A0A3M7QUF3_BRAPC|nr:hypothetical protein BpHYR1_005704 [Brachionus plicatilis]
MTTPLPPPLPYGQEECENAQLFLLNKSRKPSGYSEWNKVLLFSLTIIKKDQKLFKCVSTVVRYLYIPLRLLDLLV